MQLSVGWPPQLVPGVLVTTFMGLACATFGLLYFPNLDRPAFRWTVGPFVLTGTGAVWGLLLTMGVGFLIVPAILLGLAVFFLLRAAIFEWLAEQRRQVRQPRISVEGPARPSLAATASMTQLAPTAGLTQPMSAPGRSTPVVGPTERIDVLPEQDVRSPPRPSSRGR